MFFRKKNPARQLTEAAKELAKLRRHECDRVGEEKLRALDAMIAELREQGRGTPSEDDAAKLIRRAEQLYGNVLPKHPHPAIAENVDVVLVAVVVALGIRSFFLQPFKIPTNSMFPTLRGVVVTKLESPSQVPNPVQRLAETIVCGRAYVDFELPAAAQFLPHQCRSTGFLFLKRLNLVFATPGGIETRKLATEATFDDLARVLDLRSDPRAPRRILAKIDPGDHLFVNKVIYHFRRPQRGDSFVFRTTGLKTDYNLGRDPSEGSQFYIKRCVGTPGDTLRVSPPKLLVNDAPAPEPELQRVWSGRPGYNGYSNHAGARTFPFLSTPEETAKIPQNGYWAMGDNSLNSQDSRQWGPVPLENLVGKAMILYYPFNRKFWLIE